MKEIIDVFRMNEVDPKTRAKIILELGRMINHQHGANITELLVIELVKQIDPENEEIKGQHYAYYINKNNTKKGISELRAKERELINEFIDFIIKKDGGFSFSEARDQFFSKRDNQ